jgi:hypothetical protein
MKGEDQSDWKDPMRGGADHVSIPGEITGERILELLEKPMTMVAPGASLLRCEGRLRVSPVAVLPVESPLPHGPPETRVAVRHRDPLLEGTPPTCRRASAADAGVG